MIQTETLPKPKTLPGAVCAQWVRCGRPACKCARGELHGPYYYRFWREHGRLRKAYVKPGDLADVRAACEAHRRERGEWRDSRDTVTAYFRALHLIESGDYSGAMAIIGRLRGE